MNVIVVWFVCADETKVVSVVVNGTEEPLPIKKTRQPKKPRSTVRDHKTTTWIQEINYADYDRWQKISNKLEALQFKQERLLEIEQQHKALITLLSGPPSPSIGKEQLFQAIGDEQKAQAVLNMVANKASTDHDKLWRLQGQKPLFQNKTCVATFHY